MTLDLKDGLANLKERLRAISSDQLEDRTLLRLSVEVEPCDLLMWLARQTAFQTEGRLYWRSRDIQYEVAGLGLIPVIGLSNPEHLAEKLKSAPDQLSSLSSDTPALRLFGGLAFDPYRQRNSKEHWEDFSRPCVFYLPRYELCRESGRTWLTCNTPIDTDDCKEILERSVDSLEMLSASFHVPDGALPCVDGRQDNPDSEQWAHSITALNRFFDSGRVEKVVLARAATLSFSRPVDPITLIYRLRKRCHDHHLFLFQRGAGAAFLGASPETLYRRKGREIQTEALAGTRPRGSDETEDRRLGNELLQSEKDNHEHRFVSNMIERSLGPLCERLVRDPAPSLRRLPHVQHLLTEFCGTLKETVSDAELLATLHPTPAVGGHPREEAMRVIREIEKFDRGFYAGPIGYVSSDESEFAVGIRSGLVHGSSLTLYSGAGIVPGSEAESEWNEIEQKTAGFIEVLNTE